MSIWWDSRNSHIFRKCVNCTATLVSSLAISRKVEVHIPFNRTILHLSPFATKPHKKTRTRIFTATFLVTEKLKIVQTSRNKRLGKVWYSPRITYSMIVKLVPAWGAWVAQSVEHPTLVRVTISWFMSSSPASGLCWQLWAWSLLWIPCVLLSLLLPFSHAVSLSKINKD